jgi:ribonuclease P/MRP protein subunit POP5
MVRIKHRYLLINVLYPDEELKSSALNNKSSKNSSATLQPKNKTFNKSGDSETQLTLPWTVQFRRPSADSFNAKLLAKLIRDGVAELFGDYGAGMIAASFQGV